MKTTPKKHVVERAPYEPGVLDLTSIGDFSDERHIGCAVRHFVFRGSHTFTLCDGDNRGFIGVLANNPRAGEVATIHCGRAAKVRCGSKVKAGARMTVGPDGTFVPIKWFTNSYAFALEGRPRRRTDFGVGGAVKLRADIAEDGTVKVEKQCADGQHDMVDEPAGTYVDGFELMRQCRRCGWKVLRTKVRSPYV